LSFFKLFKKKKANPWGLYDMLGNVSEWCSDFYDDYGKGTKALPLNDPKGPSAGFLYVYRGGSFAGDRPRLRAASRRQAIDSLKEVTLGFRPVLGQKP
jgi:formylglycine-generating enzyme required for sulfatase activity